MKAAGAVQGQAVGVCAREQLSLLWSLPTHAHGRTLVFTAGCTAVGCGAATSLLITKCWRAALSAAWPACMLEVL